MPYGRTAEVGDVLADTVGMVLGLLLAVLLRDSLFARIEKWLTPN
jgi:VanZ family protein